eukprot:3461462-Rhodomonas_salina.1
MPCPVLTLAVPLPGACDQQHVEPAPVPAVLVSPRGVGKRLRFSVAMKACTSICHSARSPMARGSRV